MKNINNIKIERGRLFAELEKAKNDVRLLQLDIDIKKAYISDWYRQIDDLSEYTHFYDNSKMTELNEAYEKVQDAEKELNKLLGKLEDHQKKERIAYLNIDAFDGEQCQKLDIDKSDYIAYLCGYRDVTAENA